MKIKTLKVKKVTLLQEKEDLYDITVEKNHNFFVKWGNNFILSSNCHNLTNSARQNLLKPLEEPPKNVLWILCTTDPEKLPKAALTRCIKLYFEYPTFAECKQRLWKVCKEEYPEIKGRIKPYIKTIATNCNCQMRDSYSVLERIAAVINKDKDITDEEIESNFVNILSNFGELTTPAIRFITHALTNHFSLPLAIPNELDTARLSEFLNTLARHGHYAATYLSYKKEGSLNKIERKKFYGINFIRFDKALEQVYEKLEKKGLSSCQILKKVVTLTGGILDGINKNRQGLLTPEQAVLCGLNSYMEKVIKD